jgi:hypothetical protein
MGKIEPESGGKCVDSANALASQELKEWRISPASRVANVPIGLINYHTFFKKCC